MLSYRPLTPLHVIMDQPVPADGATLLPNHTAADLLTRKKPAGLLPVPVSPALAAALGLPSFTEAANNLGSSSVTVRVSLQVQHH